MAIAANRCFYLTLILGKCRAQTGLDTQVVLHPQTMGFHSWVFLLRFLANALNTPPVTLRWQHEIQRNCTAFFTNRGRMWFNR